MKEKVTQGNNNFSQKPKFSKEYTTKQGYKVTCLAGNLRKPDAQKAFFFIEKKEGMMKDRGMILILYLKSCPDIGSPSQFTVFQSD